MVDRDDDDPDAPASAEEIAASQRLRDALAPGARPEPGESRDPASPSSPVIALALALRAAWDPAVLSEDESRAVLDVTPTAEEQDLALALRETLGGERALRLDDHATVHLASALRVAYAPPAIDAEEHRHLVDAALAALSAMPRPAATVAKNGAGAGARRRDNVVRIAFGAAAGGLALAASIVFVITTAPPAEAPLARARTTQPLFSEPFRPGETSARIDRIASARAGDFRDNRFAKWGVR